MTRFFACLNKDLLLLWRDKAGLAILFLMPAVLIFLMSHIQDAPFRDFQESKVPLLWVDADKDSVSAKLYSGLARPGVFVLTDSVNQIPITFELAQKLVSTGEKQIAVVIPKNTTETVRENSAFQVSQTLAALGLGSEPDSAFQPQPTEILILTDPAVKRSFKNAVSTAVSALLRQTEAEMMLQALYEEMASIGTTGSSLPHMPGSFTLIKETSGLNTKAEELNFETNSVQHNVPAWTIFAMFFIVIPLAGSAIKEREEGSSYRLLTMPGSYWIPLYGKLTAYLFVSLIQLGVMLLVGTFLLPLTGLPKLYIGNALPEMIVTGLCTGWAATAFGLAVGAFLKTHQQASVFGAVAIVILAALGGIWVPSFVMPEILQMAGTFSPLSWSLNAFNDLFLRQAGWQGIAFDLLRLSLFGLVMIMLAFFRLKPRN